jgi:hypothetical protein
VVFTARVPDGVDSFTRVNLSDVRVIMVIMHVPVEELLCQAATGWIPVMFYQGRQ